MSKYAIAQYDKTVVRKITKYETEELFLYELMKLLSDGNEYFDSSYKLPIIIKMVNKQFNYDGGDSWHLMFKFEGDVGHLMNSKEHNFEPGYFGPGCVR